MTTDLIYHETFMKHILSLGHPESPRRLKVALESIGSTGLVESSKVIIVKPEKADLNEVRAMHGDDYIQELHAKSEKGGGSFTMDTSANRYTYDAALLAAGGGILAVNRIQDGVSENAYVLCRPPGHHAEHSRAFGFCFINNIAVAAQHLIEKRNLERVLIVDYDAHHGNGTQSAFYSSNRVLYVGLHQDGRTLFPGSGFPNEIGSGKGEGYNVNLAMHPGAGDRSYEMAFQRVVEPIAASFNPEFILVSVGFDGHFSDPLTSLGLTTSGLSTMNAKLHAMARKHSRGRLAFFLEGGYNLDIVGRGSQNLVEQLAGAQITRFEDSHTESENCTEYTKVLLDGMDEMLGGVWKL